MFLIKKRREREKRSGTKETKEEATGEKRKATDGEKRKGHQGVCECERERTRVFFLIP